MSKYSPKWFANQRRLAEMGVQTNPYKDTFTGTYGTAGGGLAGVKAGQLQYGPDAYTAEEASELGRTGRVTQSPTQNVASIFSSSTPTGQAEPAQYSGEVSAAKSQDYEDTIEKVRALNTGSTNTTTGQSGTENLGNALTDTGSDNATDFNLDNFEKLLTRLEASKGRQQRQKSIEGRRDIFQQGLASMMSNF